MSGSNVSLSEGLFITRRGTKYFLSQMSMLSFMAASTQEECDYIPWATLIHLFQCIIMSCVLASPPAPVRLQELLANSLSVTWNNPERAQLIPSYATIGNLQTCATPWTCCLSFLGHKVTFLYPQLDHLQILTLTLYCRHIHVQKNVRLSAQCVKARVTNVFKWWFSEIFLDFNKLVSAAVRKGKCNSFNAT